MLKKAQPTFSACWSRVAKGRSRSIRPSVAARSRKLRRSRRSNKAKGRALNAPFTKGIDHEIDDRTFIFYPLVKNEKVVEEELGTFIEKLFEGSTGTMVSYLVKNQYISSDELKKISELFEEKDE